MKKCILALISFSLAIYPCLALDINDDFVDSTLDKNLKVKPAVSKMVTDDFAQNNTAKNPVIKPNVPIADKFAESNRNKSAVKQQVIISETLPKINNEDIVRKKIVISDSSAQQIAIPIRALSLITTKGSPEEGSLVEFETIRDVTINNKTYPKGTKVLGKIETVSMNYSLGVPADLIVGNFKMGNESISGEICKVGANRSLWVKPCSYFGLFFFGAGLLLMPIRGGHAKISPNETFTVYYR